MIYFILKGLLRDRHRSLFPCLIVITGAMLTCVFFSYLSGVMVDIVRVNATIDTGHVKIMTRAYQQIASQLPNDYAITGIKKLLPQLAQTYPYQWAARIKFGGLLDIPDANLETKAQAPVVGLGLDLFNPASHDVHRLNIKTSLVRGRMPTQAGEILVSDTLAQKLEIKLGDASTLIGSTANGNMAIHSFTVVGTVQFGIGALDRNFMLADLSDVQYALDMDNAAGEILGFAANGFFESQLAEQTVTQFSQRQMQWEGQPLTMLSLKQQNGLGQYLDMVDVQGSIIVFVVVLAMSIVLWNTGLMSGIRRYGEIGIRLAIGESKWELYRSMMWEALLVGLIGSTIGTCLGLAGSYYLQEVGIDISQASKGAKFLIAQVIRARITGVSYFIGFVPGLAAMMFGTMISGLGIFKRETASLFKELET